MLVGIVGRARAEEGATRTALAPGSLAVRDVNVVPMTGEGANRVATVLVRDGRIAAVAGAGAVAVPEDARVIDGRGKYLIPGLADMHVHLYSDDEAPDAVAPDELGVMLANGVTTIRLMIGTPEHLALRREIEAGRVVGPQLWVASPQLTGREGPNCRVVTTPDGARAAVRDVADAGYDFVKLTVDITPEVFDAVAGAARERGVPIVGHVDPRVGVRRALAAGQHIEHLDNYLESILGDDAPTRRSVSNYDVFRPENWESLDFMDRGKLREIAVETARSGTYTTPTLAIPKVAFGVGQTDEEIRARPEWGLMPPKTRALYLRANERYWETAASEERRRRYVEIRDRLVKEILDAGGRIMAGSDAPEWFFGYGYTLHRELEALVAAGLTPYQALEAATVVPSAFLGASGEWGRIEEGSRADLVLLSADPLGDVRNTTTIDAVCVGGRWLDRDELDRMVDRARERVGKPAP
jgi:imidazolonepropionase-like amidohydrolase